MTADNRRTTRPHPALQLTAEETDLESLFTDSEEARKLFDAMLTAERPTRRLLIVHGLGGVGKSSLLKMYRLSCRRKGIPVALSEAQDALSVAALLADWAEDLAGDRVKLPTFLATLRRYRAIKARVEAEARNSGSVMGQLGRMGAAASPKVAMQATAVGQSSNDVGNIDATGSNVAVGSGIIQTHNIVNNQVVFASPFAATVGSGGAAAFMDWLRGLLPPSELELYLDPSKPLTNDFLQDLAKAARKQRIVLMVDTYEQMTTLDEWMCDFARRLPENVLLVISGRAVPNWDVMWDAWMGRAQLVEQKEMTPEYLRELVNRRYAHIHGGKPDPQQVEAVVQFARGLPMVAATVMQLWVKYGVEDFQAVRPQVVEDLVDRLLAGVPKEMRPAFEVAAALRYFNAEALGELLGRDDAEAIYAELRRWPFIRGRREGLAVHDTMRKMIGEAMKSHSPRRYCALHEKAAAYYEGRITKATGDERERLVRERLYHIVCANEEVGMRVFQEMAEELVRYEVWNRLRTLLNDVSNYTLSSDNGILWRSYYNARLLHLMERLADAKAAYSLIIQSRSRQADAKLKAYVLCDLGDILGHRENLVFDKNGERAIKVLEESLSQNVNIDSKLLMSLWFIGDIYRRLGKASDSMKYYQQAINLAHKQDDRYLAVKLLLRLLQIKINNGQFSAVLDFNEHPDEVKSVGDAYPRLNIEYKQALSLASIWMGRYKQTESALKQILSQLETINDADQWRKEKYASAIRDLFFVTGLQGKMEESESYLKQQIQLIEDGETEYPLINRAITYCFSGEILLRRGRLEEAEHILSLAEAVISSVGDTGGFLDLLLWLAMGSIYEIKAKMKEDENDKNFEIVKASSLYMQAHANEYPRQFYLQVCVRVSHTRVKYTQRDYAAVQHLLEEVEQVAQKHEYNNHLACLCLIQGHVAWNGHITDWGEGFDAALNYYKYALIYALRYNRFMLDELLWGGGISTPLHPIIPYCLARGNEGRQMLTALRDWWLTDYNDIGTSRPDTISPIPEGITLLEGERLAREREPGDGNPQTMVVQKIEEALSHG